MHHRLQYEQEVMNAPLQNLKLAIMALQEDENA